MREFGLIGKDIDYSYSAGYFKQKFKTLDIHDCSYVNFDLSSPDALKLFLKQAHYLSGLNVTIPYKETVIPLLDDIDDIAKKIGAINTIKIFENKLIGFNTDYYGFKNALLSYLTKKINKALILGTGGASKAIHYVLQQLGIKISYVSRKPNLADYTYEELHPSVIEEHKLIINCTPLGTYPKVKDAPPIPYESITKDHLLFDLVYRPSQTTFLKLGLEQGASITNGLKMLELQAEKSWEIWNDPHL